MGMARKAPFSGNLPLTVSDHAIERFRERAQNFLKNEGALDDKAVAYKLAWLVKHALDTPGHVEALLDLTMKAGSATRRLVDFSDEPFGRAFALMPSNEEHVITVLTEEIVQANWSKGLWAHPDGTPKGLGKFPPLPPLPPPATLPSKVSVSGVPLEGVKFTKLSELPKATTQWVVIIATGTLEDVALEMRTFEDEALLKACVIDLTLKAHEFTVWKAAKPKVRFEVEF